MTNLIKRQPQGNFIRSLAPQVRRSSLIFVGLSAIIYFLIIRSGAVLTSNVVADATKFTMLITIASCVARSIFRATYKLRSDKMIFAAQYLYLVFLFLAGVLFAFFIFRLLPPTFHADRIPISVFAIFGTIILDSLYNSTLDIMLPPPPSRQNKAIKRSP